jgi:hypothetical protein
VRILPSDLKCDDAGMCGSVRIVLVNSLLSSSGADESGHGCHPGLGFRASGSQSGKLGLLLPSAFGRSICRLTGDCSPSAGKSLFD